MSAHLMNRLSRAAAGSLAAIAIAAPAAGARPALEPPGNSGPEAWGVPGEAPAPTVVVADDGLELASAAIGAGGAAVVLLLTAAGATTLSRRHHRVGAVR